MILGLDIGGANLKAAAADGRAVSVPFALWKQPDGLTAALAELVTRFPDASEFAVTMTGELCDCYETKRQGVNAILNAVEAIAAGRTVRVWGTDGEFLSVAAARAAYLKVAASNWHALATFVGRFAPVGSALLIDIGSTTTDVVFLNNGSPVGCCGLTDQDRLREGQLVYTGVQRTPVCAIRPERTAAELFATTLDVYLLLGMIEEDPADTNTADGRPATRAYAHARMSRMLGGDPEITFPASTRELAERVHRRQVSIISEAIRSAIGSAIGQSALEHLPSPSSAIIAGTGAFLAQKVVAHGIGEPPIQEVISLNDELGSAVSACAPAYALAVLASERKSTGI